MCITEQLQCGFGIPETRFKPRVNACNRPFQCGTSIVALNLSRLVGKPTMWFLNRSDTNQAAQSQKRAIGLKFWSYVEEELYYPSSENKGADQLRLCFRICSLLVFP